MRTALATCMLLSLLGVPRPVRADAVPPSLDCMNKKEGEACRDEQGKPGACGTLGYTAVNHATDPPTVSQRTYFGCREGVVPTAAPPAPSKKCSVSAAGASSPDGLAALASALVLAAAAAVRRRTPQAHRLATSEQRARGRSAVRDASGATVDGLRPRRCARRSSSRSRGAPRAGSPTAG